MKVTVFLGPPGTGKTTRLVKETARHLETVDPDRIAYVAFTRRAAEEAADRTGGTIRNCRTIHSLAYRELGMRDGAMMQHADYNTIGTALGLRFSRYVSAEESNGGRTEGDRIRSVVEYAAATVTNPEDARYNLAPDLDVWRLRRYVATLEAYKRDTGKLDFNDLLSRVAAEIEPLELDVAIVDEAQDLSTLQWKAVQHLFCRVKHLVLAGDDDQAIFRWAGADVPAFQAAARAAKTVVLGQSYRVPRRIQEVSQSIVQQIESRYPKEWSPRAVDGQVTRVGTPEDVDLSLPGTWLLLARNGYLLREWETACRARGLPYTVKGKPSADPRHLRGIRAYEAQRRGVALSERDAALVTELGGAPGSRVPWYEALLGIPAADAAYYRAALRRGESLDAPPRVSISTIHGSKGGEADHVGLLTDRASLTALTAESAPDDEHRVWYVGTTRARESLTVVAAQEPGAYVV